MNSVYSPLLHQDMPMCADYDAGVDLPSNIVKRFSGKIMAVGYESDQVFLMVLLSYYMGI